MSYIITDYPGSTETYAVMTEHQGEQVFAVDLEFKSVSHAAMFINHLNGGEGRESDCFTEQVI